MAAPVADWANATSDTADPGTTVTLTKPTGVTSGDLLVIIVGNDDNGNTAQWLDTMTGWDLLQEAGNSTSDCHLGVYTRIADGTEGASFTVTAEESHQYWGVCVKVTHANGFTAGDYVTATTTPQAVGSSADIDITGFTNNEGDMLVFAPLAFDGGDGIDFVVTGTGWTRRFQIEAPPTGGGSQDASGCVADKSMTATGATGTCNINPNATDGIVAWQFGVYPASSAGSGLGIIPVTVDLTASGKRTDWLSPAHRATETFATDSTSHTVSLADIGPIASGDGILMIASTDSQEEPIFPNEGTDWTVVVSEGTSGSWTKAVYRKASGSEGTSITVTMGSAENMAVRKYRFDSADIYDWSTSPPEGTIVDFPTATDQPDPPSETASWTAGEDNWWYAGYGWNSDFAATGFPTSSVQQGNTETSVTGGCSLGWCERYGTQLDTWDPSVFTLDSAASNGQALTIVVRPIADTSVPKTGTDSHSLTDVSTTLDALPSAADTAALTEAITELLADPTTTDAATLAEAITELLKSYSAVDSATLADVVTAVDAVLNNADAATLTSVIAELLANASTADTFTVASAASIAADLSTADAAALAEASELFSFVDVTAEDTGTFSEVSIIAAEVATTDTGTVASTAGIAVSIASIDSAALDENVIVAVNLSDDDTLSLAEGTAAIVVQLATGDSAVLGSTANEIAAALSDTDVAAVAEASVIAASVVSLDALSLASVSATSDATSVVNKTSTDALVFVDAAAISANVTVSDSGVVTFTASIDALLAGSDLFSLASISATSDATELTPKSATDSLSLSEAITLVVSYARTDELTFADATTDLSASVAISDAFVLSVDRLIEAGVASTDQVGASESVDGIGSFDTDTATLGELAQTEANVIALDSATVAEAAELYLVAASGDTIAFSEALTSLIASLEVNDSLTLTESSALVVLPFTTVYVVDWIAGLNTTIDDLPDSGTVDLDDLGDTTILEDDTVPFNIKQGTTAPSISGILRRGGVAVDLSISTALEFRLKDNKTNKRAVASAASTTTDTGGWVYNWVAGDTDAAGEYHAEVLVTWTGGQTEIFPNTGYVTVFINEELDD